MSEKEFENRRKNLESIFKNIDDDKKCLVENLLDEVVFLEKQMQEMRSLPFVEVHPNNPAKQRPTAAAKLYKESSQSYMNAIRILVGILNKVESSAADELLERLKEFE